MAQIQYVVEIRPQGRDSETLAQEASFPDLDRARIHAAHVLREWVSEDLENINEALPVLSDDHLRMIGGMCRAVCERIDLALALTQPDGPLEVVTARGEYIAIRATSPAPRRRESKQARAQVET